MELVGGVRGQIVGGFSSLLVVASCSGNENVVVNYGIL